jgi:hypothetical protein
MINMARWNIARTQNSRKVEVGPGVVPNERDHGTARRRKSKKGWMEHWRGQPGEGETGRYRMPDSGGEEKWGLGNAGRWKREYGLYRFKKIDRISLESSSSGRRDKGATKARYLSEMGYNQENYHILEADLRNQHPTRDVQPGKMSYFGMKYEIVAPLVGPNGEMRLVRSVWMIRKNDIFARLITLIPEKKL